MVSPIMGPHRAKVIFYTAGSRSRIYEGNFDNYEDAYWWCIHQSAFNDVYGDDEFIFKIEPIQVASI